MMNNQITLLDYIFIFRMTMRFIKKQYSIIIKECDKALLSSRHEYGSNYVKMHAAYYSKKYDLSYECFFRLLGKYHLSNKLITWGIDLFIGSKILHAKDNKTALARAKECLALMKTNQLINQKLLMIISYIEKKATDDK